MHLFRARSLAMLLLAAAVAATFPLDAQKSSNNPRDCGPARAQAQADETAKMAEIQKEDVDAQNQYRKDLDSCGQGAVAACRKAAQDRLTARRREIQEKKNSEIAQIQQLLRELNQTGCQASPGGGGPDSGSGGPQGVPVKGQEPSGKCVQAMHEEFARSYQALTEYPRLYAQVQQQYNQEVQNCGTGRVAACIAAAKDRMTARQNKIDMLKSDEIARHQKAVIDIQNGVCKGMILPEQAVVFK